MKNEVMGNRKQNYINHGWFSIQRSLLSSPLWLSEEFTRAQAWIDLIGLANHTEGFIRVREARVTILRGQLGWSQVALGHRWDWTRNKVRSFLNELEKDGKIEQQNNSLTTIISIVNYDHYQKTEQREDIETTTEQHQPDTNNKKNKENNLKNENERFVPPTPNDVFDFFLEIGSDRGEAQKFIDHYTSNGWKVGQNKMQDWKATSRKWLARAELFNPKQTKMLPSSMKIVPQKKYNKPL